MYFDGLLIAPSDSEGKVEITIDKVSEDAKVIVYNLNGRTYLKDEISSGSNVAKTLDLTDARGKLFLISFFQKDLVHTRIIKL